MSNPAQGAVGAGNTDATAWLKKRMKAAISDSEAHPEGHPNRTFYGAQAIAYENVLSLLEKENRIASALAARRADSDERTAGEALKEACKPWEHYTGEPPDDGSPLSGVFVAGMVHTERLLAKLLDVTHYEGGDGSEDFDSDATQTLRNILTGAHLWDADENRPVSATPAQPAGVVPDSLREALEFYAYGRDISLENGAKAKEALKDLDGLVEPAPVVVPDSLRALSEKAGPGKLKVVRGLHDYAVVAGARGEKGPLNPADADFAAASANFVRTLLATHPTGQSAGLGVGQRTVQGKSCQGMDPAEPYDPLKVAIWAALLPFRNELLETGGVTFMGLRNAIVQAVRSFAIASQMPAPEGTPTGQGEAEADEPVAIVVGYDPEAHFGEKKPHKIIDASVAFMDTAAVGTKLYARPVAAQPDSLGTGVAGSAYTQAEYDESHEIGHRDGYQEGVQDAAIRAGLDGEYRASSDPERNVPDPDAMLNRIAERVEALASRREEVVSSRLVEAARDALSALEQSVQSFPGTELRLRKALEEFEKE